MTCAEGLSLQRVSAPFCIICLSTLRRHSSLSLCTVFQEDQFLSDSFYTHAHTPQRGHLQHRPIVMALPDTAPLLAGLLLLFHAFGGEEPRHSYHSCMGYLSYMQMCGVFFHVRQKGNQLRCLSVKHQLLNCSLCSVEIHQRKLPKRFQEAEKVAAQKLYFLPGLLISNFLPAAEM